MPRTDTQSDTIQPEEHRVMEYRGLAVASRLDSGSLFVGLFQAAASLCDHARNQQATSLFALTGRQHINQF